MPNVEISDDAMAYLKSQAIPLEDTTATVVDRLIARLKALHADVSHVGSANPSMQFSLEDVPSVKFTSISKATVNGQSATQNFWNNILEDVIAACAEKGISRKQIRDAMSANIQLSEQHENGYRFVPSAKLSFQGLEANRAFKNIVALAQAFNIPIDMHIRWQDNDDAALPNQTARIVFP